MDDRSLPASAWTAEDGVSAFVQAVHAAETAQERGEIAITLLSKAFEIYQISLYQAHSSRSALTLLAHLPIPSSTAEMIQKASSSLDRLASLIHESKPRKPLFIADLHHAKREALTTVIAPLVDPKTRGCLCLPLWCGDTLEGVLLAEFAFPLVRSTQPFSTWVVCGLSLAAALSAARLRQEAADTRLRMQELLDQLPEGLLIIDDVSGVVRSANPVAAQILGVPLTDLVGRPLVIPPQALESLSASQGPRLFWLFAAIRALSGEALHRVETVVVRADGTQVPVLCSSTPLQTSRGGPAGALLILQDMTTQKRLERDRNAFLALASHELRTPLSAVLGYADLVQRMASDSEGDQRDPALLGVAARQIALGAEQMAFLIEEMLDLSSLDQDQLVLHLGEHDLVEILTQTVHAQAVTTERHQITLTLDDALTEGKCIARVDALRLRQAFSNLVKNAIKYSPRGGAIEVGLRLEGYPPSHALCWVSDQGVGIAQEDLPHLFERFYRSQNLDQALSGLGIGLYLVKQIITRHGGRLWVDSVQGQGSTFFLLLPCMY